MSVPAPNRKPSPAEFIKVAGEIDRFSLQQYGKKCYADIKDALMIEIYHEASALLTCVTRANDPYLPTSTDSATVQRITIPMQQERVKLFTEAKGHVAALHAKYTELYVVRPIKHRYRGQKKKIATLLNLEYKMLKSMIEKEQSRLRQMKE